MGGTEKMAAPKGGRSGRLGVRLMALLLVAGLGLPALAFAQTVTELVESPPLPNVRGGGDWNYDDQFTLDNVYDAIKNNDYQAAAAFVKKLARSRSDSLPVLQLAVHVAMRSGRFQDARESLTGILAIEPDNLPARVRLGFVQAKLRDYDRAEATYETILAANPSAELKDFTETALAQLKSDRQAADQRMAADWAKLEPRAAEFKAAGRLDELTFLLDDYLEKYPFDLRARMLRGETKMSQKKFGDAREIFLALLGTSPDEKFTQEIVARLVLADKGLNTLAWSQAEKLKAQGDLPGLEKQLDHILALQPDSAAALTLRGATRFQMGESHWPAARADLTAALQAPYISPEDRALATSLSAELPSAAEEEAAALATRERDALWGKVQESEADLRARNDSAGLEQLYTDLITDEPALATYGYSSRGYLRLSQNRPEEAGRDFQEAMARTDDPALKADFEAALAQVEQLSREAAMRERGDWPGLEKMYTESIAEDPKQGHVYASRGYARLAQNRLEEAVLDFKQALALTDDPEAQTSLEEALAQAEKQARLAEIMAGLPEREERYKSRKDRTGLVQLYDGYIREFPESALFWAKRGFARLDLGRTKEGRSDLRKALQLNPDPQLKRGINDALAGGGAPGGGPAVATADTYLARAGEQVQNNNYDGARTYMLKLNKYTLTGPQTGRRDFLTAQILWGEQKYDEAYPWYQKALVNLPREFWASEAYSRMAQYHLMQGHKPEAAACIDQSLAIEPDFVWHKIQAGNIYASLDENEKALAFFQEALADQSLKPEDIYFYRPLAQVSLNLGDRDGFDQYMRRYIDQETARINRKPVRTDEDTLALYRIKKEFTDMSQRYGGHFFVFGNSYDNNDYLSSFTGEVKMINPVPGFRNEIYALASGTLTSSLSGLYYDPWSEQDFPYTSNSHLSDSLYAAVGARVYPFPAYDFYFAVEQRFKIGDYTTDDTLLLLNLYEALGNDWEPLTSKDEWLFASIYSQLTYSTRANDVTFSSDGRLGRSYSLDCENMLVLTPFIGAAVGYGGEWVDKAERWSLEAGPGLSLKKWFQEEDSHKVPNSSLDFALQYRFGLSHNRHDVLSATIYYSF